MGGTATAAEVSQGLDRQPRVANHVPNSIHTQWPTMCPSVYRDSGQPCAQTKERALQCAVCNTHCVCAVWPTMCSSVYTHTVANHVPHSVQCVESSEAVQKRTRPNSVPSAVCACETKDLLSDFRK